jgi:hypothetical protein
MFACANYLVFEGILPAIHSFKGGDWLCLLQPGFSGKLKKSMYLSKETHLCYKEEHLAHSLPLRIKLVFKIILPVHHGC